MRIGTSALEDASHASARNGGLNGFVSVVAAGRGRCRGREGREIPRRSRRRVL